MEAKREVDGPGRRAVRGRAAQRLVLGLTLLACGVGAGTWLVGQIRLRSAVGRIEGASPGSVEEPTADALAALDLLERALDGLEERVEVLDASNDEATRALLAPFARAEGWEDIPYEMALRTASSAVLEEGDHPEAWALLESFAQELDPLLAAVDGACERAPRLDMPATVGGQENPRALRREKVLNGVLPWLSTEVALEVRHGSSDAALRRTQQALLLAAGTHDVRSSIDLLGLVFRTSHVLGGLRLVLGNAPHDLDVSRLASELERIDPVASLKAALVEDRDFTLQTYLEGNGLKHLGGSPFNPSVPRIRLFFYPLVAGHDGARFLHLGEDVLRWPDGSMADALRLVEDVQSRRDSSPWYAPTADDGAALLVMGFAPCVELLSELRLARIVLTDRIEGRARALALLDETTDPADDGPIERRFEPDGTLTLWCLGSDRLDAGGIRPGDDGPQGDVVWTLPAPR